MLYRLLSLCYLAPHCCWCHS